MRRWRAAGTIPSLVLGAQLALAGAMVLPASGVGQADQLMIRQLRFDGNRAFDDYTLSTVIATTNSSAFARLWWLRWMTLGNKRYFTQRQFGRDLQSLRAFYGANGYRDVKIDTVVRRGPEAIYLTIKIQEGLPERLTGLTIPGLDSVPQAWRVYQDLPIRTGDPFSRFKLDSAADTIAVRLRERGYPTAVVDTSYHETPATHQATAELKVVTGKLAVFGPIHVEGNERLDTAFVASLVPARPGQPYRLNDLFRSQRSLYNSDLFRLASVAIDTAHFHPGDSVVPLRVTVAENRGHSARGSLGYGTDDCVRTGAGWTARNFPSTGLVLDLTGRLSKIGVGTPLGFGAEHNICSRLAKDSVGSRLANYGLTISLRRNAFLSPDNTLVFSVFGERRSEFAVYLRKEIGASVSLTRETSARVPVTLSYRVSYGTTLANSVSFCAFFNACVASDITQLRERRLLTTLSLSVLRQRVNNLLDPTRGSVLSFGTTVSSRFLGSSALQQFVRLLGDASAYVPVTRSLVLAGHVRGGIILSPKVDLASGQANFVPPDQRFYAGGPNDVRGYERNELGPVVYLVPRDSLLAEPPNSFPSTAARVSATGGSRLGVANLELRFPSPIFAQRVRFAVFADAGALWEHGGPGDIRVTPGAGIRIASPLGPIRFDVGYNRYQLEPGTVYTTTPAGDLVQIRDDFVKDRTRRLTFHFSVSQAF